MNIVEILRRHARERPHVPAIIDTQRGRARVTTFAELDQASAQAATLLRQHGLRPGAAVLILQPMSLELYVALLALFRLGLVAMFLDPSAGREHMRRCCALQPPAALIASGKAQLSRWLTPALFCIPTIFALGLTLPGAIPWSRSRRLPPCSDLFPCAADTPALLTFTSGSTGQPKAAVRSHGFLIAQHRTLENSLRLQPETIDLTTLPIVLLANLASGVTSLIPNADLRNPGAVDPVPILCQIDRHRPASSAASPAFFERLIAACVQQGRALPSFRRLFSGGAPVFPRLLDQLQSVAPQAEVVAVYGSTEAEPIAHIARHEISDEDMIAMREGKGLLAGGPVTDIQLCILRDQWGTAIGPFTEETFLQERQPTNIPGEIVVNGDHVLTGYLHGQGDDETKFRVGDAVWHRTGDAGYLDEQGRLWLLGRCSARIGDDKGELFPFAVESAVYQDPAVRRAAVVAHAGRRLLLVEPFAGMAVDVETIQRQVAWACLDEIRLCTRIPVDKRHNAKIDYPALRQWLER
ncbi:MAG: AMP-binding protein [Gemmataceae bacterium]